MLCGMALGQSALAAGQTTRVSIATDGTPGDSGSFNPSISSDGRYVAFTSGARNLVQGVTNNTNDVFVHDRVTGETTRVSIASDGTEGNGGSSFAAISADGRFVAFQSVATNLVVEDTNGQDDIFVHDRQTGETTRVSVASNGQQASGYSYFPAISANGRFIAFESFASNLVVGDTNGTFDIFVHDRETGATTRVSVASDGTEGDRLSRGTPAISADGRFVAFYSFATNLVSEPTVTENLHIYVHDRDSSTTTRVSIASDGTPGNSASHSSPSISSDGRLIAFWSHASNLVEDDTNEVNDVFVHDRLTRETARVSVASDGTQGNSFGSEYPSISGDGRYVGFHSYSTNLVENDTFNERDVFVHDRRTGATSRVSVSNEGTQSDGRSLNPSLSGTGRFIAFESIATNLVPGDPAVRSHIYVRDRGYTDAPLCWSDKVEGAWADGSRYVGGKRGSWATYTTYSPGSVILWAARNKEAGKVSFSEITGGKITINVMLDPNSWRFAPDTIVSIQDYETYPPARNPKVGRFAFKAPADHQDPSLSIRVPLANYYGIHADLQQAAPCSEE